ncbi:MAG: CopG family transcriptional regulator [Hormoscilla sp. GUM202]|nr:CopG family transcriptional regulator [Hormoscilla sp. GUM202]
MNQERIKFEIDREKIEKIEDMHRWQQEIEKGLLEAEAGDFASEEEVQAVFAKLTNSN